MFIVESAPPGVYAEGSCYRCHRGEPLVDMDAVIVGEGTLAICFSCVDEAGRLVSAKRKQTKKGAPASTS